jgi:hypothetical protein
MMEAVAKAAPLMRLWVGRIRDHPVRFALFARFRPLAMSLLRLRKQGFLDDHQIGESEQGVQLRGVLGQAAVAQLPVPE